LIQIDDAGSGSLVGGTCIGAIRVETGEYYYDFIPIECYREYSFQSKQYLKETDKIVFRLLNRLCVRNNEKVEICQGYMFDSTRFILKNKGYKISSVKIGEPLQNIIENTFQEYALALGVPIQYVKYTKYPFHFHRILRWVYADYENRALLCKTGWKSWKRHGNLKPNISYETLNEDNYICLKCGKFIKKDSKVKVLEYFSNCKNIIYLHIKC